MVLGGFNMKRSIAFVAIFTAAGLAARPSQGEPATAQTVFNKTLNRDGVSFTVASPNSGSVNKLTITPQGLSEDSQVRETQIDGIVSDAVVDDLNADGSPEIYVFVTSAGSGSYGTLVAYGATAKKSLSDIFLPDISEDKKLSKGYMGHDQFSIADGRFVRRFPIYKSGDPNCCPSGGMRQIRYKLTPGEAAWVLRPAGSSDERPAKSKNRRR
jgi:hypothetical protein